mmetsp:Transcript_12499/g.29624  ORF Transcript_12499/g.29624 Transcript_12499/m.29624 type:complete len:264 (+) Transcript_12499:335-1126(+)
MRCDSVPFDLFAQTVVRQRSVPRCKSALLGYFNVSRLVQNKGGNLDEVFWYLDLQFDVESSVVRVGFKDDPILVFHEYGFVPDQDEVFHALSIDRDLPLVAGVVVLPGQKSLFAIIEGAKARHHHEDALVLVLVLVVPVGALFGLVRKHHVDGSLIFFRHEKVVVVRHHQDITAYVAFVIGDPYQLHVVRFWLVLEGMLLVVFVVNLFFGADEVGFLSKNGLLSDQIVLVGQMPHEPGVGGNSRRVAKTRSPEYGFSIEVSPV